MGRPPFRRAAAIVAAALLVAACGDDDTTTTADDTVVEDTTTAEMADGYGHTAGFEADAPFPTVALTVTEDPKFGWNVQVETTDYTFAPEKASTMETTSGEGHAHLYVDGRKVTRMYGEWFHVDDGLAAGEHEFRVELSANDHSPYLAAGEPIEAVQTVTVAGAPEGSDADEATPDADQVIEAAVVGDSVENGGRHEVAVGDTVALVITSDVDDEIHVHGYDIYAPIGPAGPATVLVEATIPGVWEVELHDSGLLLVELAVS